MNSKAFTLPELMIVIGIILILFTVSFYSLSKTHLESGIQEYATELESDLREAQSLNINNVSCGVYIESDKFTLFYGESYDPINPDNIITVLPEKYSLTGENVPGNIISFEKITGYVKNYVNPINLVLTLEGTQNSQSLTLNKMGVIEVN